MAARPRSKGSVAEIDREPGGPRLVFIAIGLLSLAVLPHLGHLHPAPVGLFLLFAGWRLVSLCRPGFPRNRWTIYLFALIGFSVSAWLYGAPLGRDPGVAFLIVLLGLKCMELNHRRDLDILVLLGYFTIITHFLYADGINWFLPLLLLVVGFTWLLVKAGHFGQSGSGLADLRLVGRMFLQALPFVIVLFYLFPRLPGSVFLFQSDTRSAMTGLSNTLTMGSVSELIESSEVAFVATFDDGPLPGAHDRYWRGSVLWVTDGREWRRGRHLPFLRTDNSASAIVPGSSRYEITLQPGNQNWLFSLDFPGTAPPGASIDSDHHLYLNRRVDRPYRYDMTIAGPPIAGELDRVARWMALNTGGTVVTPRLRRLVAELTDGTTSPDEIARRALAHFNQNPFVYTLRPPLLTSESPVDEFLFETRRGFCGHYASSFAILMRLAGVPTRLVTGYLGGQENPRAGQIVVRQSEAHAWTEIWDDAAGWIRVDPTAAVAPERIEHPIDFASSLDREGVVLFEDLEFIGLRRLAIELVWLQDTIKAKWNRWFTTFDRDRQQKLLESLGLGNIDLRYVSMAAFLLALGLLSLVSLMLFRNERRRTDPVLGAYNRFRRKIADRGVDCHPGEGPLDFSARAARALPGQKQLIEAVTRQYIALRYAGIDGNDEAGLRRLRRLVRSL